MYISQDPIGLAGNNPTLYGYVFDNNTQIDLFGLNIPNQGYHREVYSPTQVKESDLFKEWDRFLGNGTQTNIHPRTGAVDPDRIVVKQADGTWRSIRFGSHEMKSVGTTKMHYHEEIWRYDPVKNEMNVDNTVRRIKCG